MKIIIELPSEWEACDLKVTGNGRRVELTPLFQQGTSSARVAYLRAEGANGTAVLAVLSVSGTTGRFTTSSLRAAKLHTAFDAPAEQA